MRSLPLVALILVSACAPLGAPTTTPRVSPRIERLLVGGDLEGSLGARARLLEAAGPPQLAARAGRRGSDAIADLVGAYASDAGTLAVVGPGVFVSELLDAATPRLAEAVPVARLASEALVLAVAPASSIEDAKALRARLERDASGVRFAGAELGSLEHHLAALLVKEATGGVRGLVFAAYAGTPQAVAAVAGGQSEVLVARFGDLRAELRSGRLRPLAVTSTERLPGSDIPTLRQSGIDLVLLDWALLVAPPRITLAELGSLREQARRAHAAAAWTDAVRRNGWVDDFSTEAMTTFVGTELSRATASLRDLALIR